MQNMRLIALLVLEIWRHKISLIKFKFFYLPPENGLNLKKEFLYPEWFFSTQINVSNFQAENKFF